MKKLLVVIFTIFALISGFAQHKTPSGFIPKGYVLYEQHFGDLNHDGQDDCVLIIKGTAKEKIVVDNYEKTVDRNRRGIIILLKSTNGYQLADKNYDCFSSEHEDGGGYYPPQLWIKFENNNLKLLYRHGKYGDWSYLFKYQNSNFEMIRFEETQSNGPTVLKETRIDFLTKQKWVRKNTNTDTEINDEVFEETQSPIKIEALIKLSEIKDFDEYPVLTRFAN